MKSLTEKNRATRDDQDDMKGAGVVFRPVESQHSRGQVTCEFGLVRRTSDGPEREDQMVTTTPIQVDGRDFSIFALHDVDPLVAVEHLGI